MTEAAASASQGHQNRKKVIMDHLRSGLLFEIDTCSQSFSVNCRLPLIEVAGNAGEEDTLFILRKVQFSDLKSRQSARF